MSTLKVNNIQNTSGGFSSTPTQIEQGRAKAWASIDGTSTPSFNDNFNVSSLTDHGNGDYTVNLQITMSNTNYAVVGMSENWEGSNSDSYTAISEMKNTRTTSSFRIRCLRLRFDQHPPQFQDSTHIGIAVFGDL